MGARLTHNHVGLYLGGDDRVTVNSISGRQVGLPVGEDFAVELAFPSGKIGTCSILVDHSYEGSIPGTASAIGP